MTSQFVKAVGRKETVSPKTVLGFFAAILVAVVGGVALVSGALLTTGRELWLLPWLLVFAGVLSVGLIVTVAIIASKDPSKLLLTHVTGSEFVEIQHTRLGDSTSGEMIVAVPVPQMPSQGVQIEATAIAAPEIEEP